MRIRKFEIKQLRRRRTGGALRLAFSLAIAGIVPGMSLPSVSGAESDFPQLPSFPAPPTALTDLPSPPACPTLGRGFDPRAKLVQMLGLSNVSQPKTTKITASCESVCTNSPELSLPEASSFPTIVIAASATEAAPDGGLCSSPSPNDSCSSDSSKKVGLSLTVAACEQPGNAAAMESSEGLLSDVAIPLFPTALSDVEKPVAAPASSPRLPEIVNSGKSMRLNASPTPVASPLQAEANTARVPELAQSSAIQTAVASAEQQPENQAARLSLSDRDDAASSTSRTATLVDPVKPATAGEPALDASKSSRQPAIAAVQTATTGMRVQIEGEPSQQAKSLVPQARVAGLPRPTFEPQTAATPAATADSGRDGESSRGISSRIRATLASRQTAVADEKDETATAATSAVPVVQFSTSKTEFSVGDSLSISAQDSLSISVDAQVVETSVEDPSVCQLIHAGERTVSLIGIKTGSTRIAIVKISATGGRLVEIHAVTVQRDKADEGLVRIAQGIHETVARLFPNSDIEVTTADGSLIVRGVSGSETEAKRVLSLVRKTALVPVVDQVQVHR